MAQSFKNIVLSVALNEECQGTLKTLKNNKIFENARVHLLHTVTIYTYLNELSLNTYPSQGDYATIENLVMENLRQLQTDIFFDTEIQPTQVDCHCHFHTNPKNDMVEFLKKEKADLVIVATRGKHGVEGLFSSSFTEYLSKFAPCDILVLRQKD